MRLTRVPKLSVKLQKFATRRAWPARNRAWFKQSVCNGSQFRLALANRGHKALGCLPLGNCVYESFYLAFNLLLSVARAREFRVQFFMPLPKRLSHASDGVVDHFNTQDGE